MILSRIKVFVATIFFLAAASLLHAQEDAVDLPLPPAPVINGFAVLGNETTRPEIILREISLKVGDTINVEEVEYAKSRIYSLGLFNRVDISWPPLDSTILLIEVDERWFLYPVPIVNLVDRDWDKWNFGLGVKHENLRGRNEKLFVGGALGYNPWASISYGNPWVLGEDGRSAFFSETSAGYSSVENKSRASRGEGPNFREIHFAGFQTLGKRFSPYHSVWMSAGYSYIEVTDKREGRTLSPGGIDRYITLSAGAQHDTRNLKEYPTSGIYAGAAIAKKGIGIGDVDMMAYVLDMRVYKPLYKDVSLALRALTQLSSGPSIPNYEHFYYGFSERQRGHFEEEREGENLFGAFAELRIPIVPQLYLYVPEVPIKQFRTWKLGLYGALFFDTGIAWNKGDRPLIGRIPHGYGAGLHFLLPYGTVFRVDRAWDESGRGEWVLDVGAAF
ncbi:MAG: BamA/TamA family outer membrane protein [Bacteroidetes bacterium]|nr:BamA/TamA family outer membrane protein [Bacteroidota bacterium]